MSTSTVNQCLNFIKYIAAIIVPSSFPKVFVITSFSTHSNNQFFKTVIAAAPSTVQCFESNDLEYKNC
jgi:hypothetical protein